MGTQRATIDRWQLRFSLWSVCRSCRGSGEVERLDYIPGDYLRVDLCTRCDGSGSVWINLLDTMYSLAGSLSALGRNVQMASVALTQFTESLKISRSEGVRIFEEIISRAGQWEAVFYDGMWRVRWSIPGPEGDYLWVSDHPPNLSGERLAKLDARDLNESYCR